MPHPEFDELVHPLHGREPIESLLGVTVRHQDAYHGPELDERGRFDLPVGRRYDENNAKREMGSSLETIRPRARLEEREEHHKSQ